MTTPRRAWLARAFWTLSVVFGLMTLVLETANDPTQLLVHLFGALVNLSFATVGVLIALRRPQNHIGWLLLVGALILMVGDAMLEYGVYDLITMPHSLPGGDWMAWYGFGVRGSAFMLIATFLLLLFPDGQLPSPGWRWAAWLVMCAWLLASLSTVFGASSGDFRLPFLHNPLGVALPAGVSDLLETTYGLTFGAAEAACVAATVVRFRRAKADERQQLKWFAYAAVLGIVVLCAILILNILLPRTVDKAKVGTALFDLMVAGLPIAVGIAILKYHLYEIDLIIRRTLVYSVLTALLVSAYFGSVVVLQGLSRALFGESQSQLVTVLSTLAIAALFVPLRARIQGFIDRRFYRRKYDAARTLAAFSNSVRDEVELGRLAKHLTEVVDETLQPETVTLWLQSPASDVKR